MIEFRGETLESVTPNHAIGYMSADMSQVTTWEGKPLGEAKIISSWKMIGSTLTDRQYQVECTIAGRRYTGRTMGALMLWRGKAKTRLAEFGDDSGFTREQLLAGLTVKVV